VRRARRWDIFCRVVDNFGDIGVCWRLACVLAREHDVHVRLVVDRLDLLRRITGDPEEDDNHINIKGIDVVRWCSTLTPDEDVGVVIEAFACELPSEYVDVMASMTGPPLWINLEYLSAEPWIEGCHGLVSRHPQLGLDKLFVFPGFVPASGGLLREADLLARRDRFRAAPDEQLALWHSLGVPPPLPGERRASLFGYENPAVVPLLDWMRDGPQRWTVLLPEGRSVADLAAWSGGVLRAPGDRWQGGNLSVQVIPFSPQPRFDQLLWACDLNMVRGEDSLLRAIWAARPLLWQAYPQDRDAHHDKLLALLGRLRPFVDSVPGFDAVSRQWRRWNGIGGEGADGGEPALWLAALEAAVPAWCASLAEGPELAESLVKIVDSGLK